MKRVYHRIMAITLMLTMTGFGCNSIAASESEAELQGGVTRLRRSLRNRI